MEKANCTALGKNLTHRFRRVILHSYSGSVRAHLECCVKFGAPWCTKRRGRTGLSLLQGHKVVGGWNIWSGEISIHRDVKNMTGPGPDNLLYWTCFEQEVGPLGLQSVFPAYMFLWFWYISYLCNLLFSVMFYLLNYLLNLTSYGKIKLGITFIINSYCCWRMIYLHILTSCAYSFKSRKPLRDLKYRTTKVMSIFA